MYNTTLHPPYEYSPDIILSVFSSLENYFDELTQKLRESRKLHFRVLFEIIIEIKKL